MAPQSEILFTSELWQVALERFGKSTQLTVQLFDPDEHMVLGPLNSTPLFDLFHRRDFDPGLMAQCARQCLEQAVQSNLPRPALVVSEYHGLTVVGTSLVLSGQIVGAAVAGYALADFSQSSEVQILARKAGIGFAHLWEIIRMLQPVPRSRLMGYGEVMQVLGEALLVENQQTRRHAATENQLNRELNDTLKLQEISGRMIRGGDVQALVEGILDAAIGMMNADFGSVQVFHPDRGQLELIASRGFNEEAEKFWKWVAMDSGSTCAAALRDNERVIAEDLETCEFVAGTKDLDIYRGTGIRAVQSTPLLSRSGALLGMISTHWRAPHRPWARDLRHFDVLARQAADLLERARGERARSDLAAIVESSDDAIIGENLDAIITSWNRGAERMFGYSEREAVGMPVTMILPPDRMGEETSILERIRRNEAVEHYETVRRRKDGTLLDISLTVSPIVNGQGKVIGASKISRDITDQKRAAQERENLLVSEHQARREAEQANRAKDEFLAVVSHELLNPLSVITLWAQLIKSERDPARLTHAGEVIDRNAQQQRRLIEDLLDLNRMERGTLSMDMSVQDLSALLASLVENFQMAAKDRKIILEASLPDQQLFVNGDAVRLRQIFANIITNSFKYTAQGMIRVQAEAEDADVIVRIRDTGKGITPEFLPKALDMFRQQETGNTRTYSGLGIGLALVKDLVQLHGGVVEITSPGADQGTEVIVRLPRWSSRAEIGAGKMPAAVAESARELSGLSVLVIEDSDDARDVAEVMLKSLGASVSTATDGLEALQVLESADPDVILCDLAMPRMDGFEFIEEFRRKYGPMHAPVLAVSAFTAPVDHARTRAAGFAAHVDKPFTQETLLTALANVQRAA